MMQAGRYRVRIRRALAPVKPEAEQIDGRVFDFTPGWVITSDDSSLYAGETVMVPDMRYGSYPMDAPAWIASGDLQPERREEWDATFVADMNAFAAAVAGPHSRGVEKAPARGAAVVRDRLKYALGWLCFQAVMELPVRLDLGVYCWLLKWAGYYAHHPAQLARGAREDIHA